MSSFPPTIPGDARISALQVKRNVVVKDTVSQETSITTDVTSNASAGVVTTFTTGILATGNSVSFTVNNSWCSPTSIVHVSVNGYTSGPVLVTTVSAVANGSFVIVLANAGTVSSTDEPVTLSYTVC
jgi:hypothetical protein